MRLALGFHILLVLLDLLVEFSLLLIEFLLRNRLVDRERGERMGSCILDEILPVVSLMESEGAIARIFIRLERPPAISRATGGICL